MKKVLANLAEVAFFAIIDGMTFAGETIIGIGKFFVGCDGKRR
jgi:hypothetical protein